MNCVISECVYIYRFQQLITLHFHRQFLVIMLLMALADLVIEKVLLVGEGLAAADVFQEEQGKCGGYYVAVHGY